MIKKINFFYWIKEKTKNGIVGFAVVDEVWCNCVVCKSCWLWSPTAGRFYIRALLGSCHTRSPKQNL